MNDFVTLHNVIYAQGDGPVEESYHAALDRIEAEIERLQAEQKRDNERARMNIRDKQTEIERLRVLVKAAYGTLPAQPELEIEGNTVQGKA